MLQRDIDSRILPGNEELKSKLQSPHEFGCRRPNYANSFVETLQLDNVQLETSGIIKFTETGLLANSKEYDFDLIIYATGYDHIKGFTEIRIKGENETLLEFWNADFPLLHKQLTAPSFPNMFFIGGPGTGLPFHGTIGSPLYFEYLIHNMMEILAYMQQRQYKVFDTRLQSMEAYKDSWFSWNKGKSFEKCVSFWKSKRGMANYLIWPRSMIFMWWMTRVIDENC